MLSERECLILRLENLERKGKPPPQKKKKRKGGYARREGEGNEVRFLNVPFHYILCKLLALQFFSLLDVDCRPGQPAPLLRFLLPTLIFSLIFFFPFFHKEMQNSMNLNPTIKEYSSKKPNLGTKCSSSSSSTWKRKKEMQQHDPIHRPSSLPHESKASGCGEAVIMLGRSRSRDRVAEERVGLATFSEDLLGERVGLVREEDFDAWLGRGG